MSNLSIYGGFENEVIGLTHYENQYYIAPQVTSDSGCNLPEVVNTLDYYSQTNSQVSYPVIPVMHGGTTYFFYPHVVYLPVYYFVPAYFTYQDPTVFEEPSVLQDNSNEFAGVRCNYACDDQPEESGVGDAYTANNSIGLPDEIVSQAVTSCFYYEEFPETLYDAAVNSDTEESSSEKIIEQDSLTVLNEEEITVKTENAPAVSRSDSAIPEDEDPVFLYGILSSLNIIEVKEEMKRNYNNKKNNLYNEVLKGYMKKEKVLKELNWKWDPYLPKIPEEIKRKKTFDMKKYYFDDCLRIPKREPRYEEDSEKYYLYQMLGSLKLDILEGYMEENYNKGKEKRYRRACKGYRTKKKHLKELQWESTSLGPIPEDEELQISKKEFKKNFRKDLKNIALQNESWGNYLADVLKKSVPTSTPISGETQNLLNEEGCTLDNQQIAENPQLSMPSSVRIDNPNLVTPNLVLCKKRVKFEFQEIDEHPHPYVVFPDRMEDNIPAESTISLSKAELNCESQIVEESHPAISSVDRVENGILETTEILLRVDKIDGGYHKIFDETDFSMNSGDRIENERLSAPDVIEPVCESQKIEEETHPATSSADRVKNGILETTEILLREEELDDGYHKIFDETEFSMNSRDRIENERLSAPDVIEPVCESQKIEEESHPATSSADRVKNGILETTEILLREEELDDGYHKIFDETEFSMNSGDRIENERLSAPDVIEPVCESQKIEEESHPATSSADRVKNGILETTEILLREEELDDGYHKIFDETEFSMNSEERIENERLSVPGVIERDGENEKFYSIPAILEPPTIAAASEINNNKKRFSSLRKFLSRICCCKKTPPS